jgi:hypothetical protein
VESAIARQQQSQFVRAADRKRNRELMVEQSQIDNVGMGAAEMLDETVAQLRAQNELGSASLELLMNANVPLAAIQWWRGRSPVQAVGRAYNNLREAGDTIIIGQQIKSGSDPMTDDYGRTRQ